MSEVASGSAFVETLKRSRLFNPEQLGVASHRLQSGQSPADFLAQALELGWITAWQAKELGAGRYSFFLGDYKLVARLGVGGRGIVYQAEHVTARRPVAIKILARELVDKPEAVQRFRREVQLAAALNHVNIVAAYDAHTLGKLHFLVMEFVPGKDLSCWIEELGKLPAAWACECIRQAALGLQHAHEHGMVHRDIKPGNIMVAGDSVQQPPLAKILDLGFARNTTEAPDGVRITQPGQVFGTPDYMSPEQAQDASIVDIRSDVFSLGCTLFRMLTGKYPFSGDTTMQKLLARVKGNAVKLRVYEPSLPAGLEAVLKKMLARDIEARYQTPLEAAEALEPYCMRADGAAPAGLDGAAQLPLHTSGPSSVSSDSASTIADPDVFPSTTTNAANLSGSRYSSPAAFLASVGVTTPSSHDSSGPPAAKGPASKGMGSLPPVPPSASASPGSAAAAKGPGSAGSKSRPVPPPSVPSVPVLATQLPPFGNVDSTSSVGPPPIIVESGVHSGSATWTATEVVEDGMPVSDSSRVGRGSLSMSSISVSRMPSPEDSDSRSRGRPGDPMPATANDKAADHFGWPRTGPTTPAGTAFDSESALEGNGAPGRSALDDSLVLSSDPTPRPISAPIFAGAAGSKMPTFQWKPPAKPAPEPVPEPVAAAPAVEEPAVEAPAPPAEPAPAPEKTPARPTAERKSLAARADEAAASVPAAAAPLPLGDWRHGGLVGLAIGGAGAICASVVIFAIGQALRVPPPLWVAGNLVTIGVCLGAVYGALSQFDPPSAAPSLPLKKRRK